MNDRFWAKVLFKEFIRHYRKLDDAQIVADVRKSMDDLEDLVDDADSFGSKMVRWSMERADQPFATAARENGKKGGRPKKIPQDAPNGNAGVDMYDAGNGAASKSPTSCDQFTADGDIREDSQARPDGSAIKTRAHDALGPSANIYGYAATREGAEVVDSRESGAAVPTTVSGQFRGSAKNQGESNTSSTVPAVCPESGDISKARQGQALESRRTGGSSVRGMAKVAQPSVRSFGESGLVHMTDAQANSLRSYYGEDFDRAVSILENYILSLPSKAEGDEKGDSKYWREDYAKRNHYFTMRRDNWVDNALKKSKTVEIRLEKSKQNPKSFKQMDADDRTEFFSKSIFDKEAI